MKHLTPCIIGVFIILSHASILPIYSQPAPERSTPYAAMKWEADTPLILLDAWYTLTAIDGVPINEIITFAKKEKKSRWQKYVSEDIVEIMRLIEKPMNSTASLSLTKDGRALTKQVELTKENRRSVRKYNDEHKQSPSAAADESKQSKQEMIVSDLQKNIAKSVNIKNDAVYGFKSAKIEFTTTGHKLYAGKETYYIDDYGKTVVIVTDKPGLYEPENTTMIWKDGKTTMINHHTKKYYTTPVRTKSSEPPTIAYSNETQRKQGGYTKKGKETIAGKECDVYEHRTMKVTYYLWKNIDLKLINYSLGDMGYTREAVSVQENISLPSSLFELPDGYKK